MNPQNTNSDSLNPESGPERWQDFLTPQQRFDAVADILTIWALRSVTDDRETP